MKGQLRLNQTNSHRLKFAMLSIVALGLFYLDILSGSVAIPHSEIVNIIWGNASSKGWEHIILEFRMPKAVAAVAIGGGLSVAGLLMQTLFRNPLAGPDVLGINSGASLGVALFVLASNGLIAFLPGGGGLVFAAVLGASTIMLIVLMASRWLTNPVSLLIIGIMFGSLAGSLVSILQYYSSAENVQRFVIWTFGSLAGISTDQLEWLLPIIGAGLLISVYLIKPLDALVLGDQYASALGVPIKRIRYIVIISCSLIAGTITAFAGPIAFVGVAVPHIARNIFRSSDHATIVPGSILCGIVLMLACDIITQLPGNGTVLPINAVTALFGAPVVIWVVLNGAEKGGER